MDNLVADFIISNPNPIEAEYTIAEDEHFDCSFEINVSPNKVSQLKNDLSFQTKTEVDDAIQAEADIINARIDTEVDVLTTEINKKVETINGSDLIGVSREENTVTITSKTFVFEQGIASTEWVINHNLNKRPSIQLTYTTGESFEAHKEYISNNQVIIKLDSAATGYAYLN